MEYIFSKREEGLVSIVIPTYNQSNYICETLDGFKNQTYKNLEVIIVDDCSSDNTEKVIEDWKQNNIGVFKKFMYLKLPRNREEEWAYNIGLCMTTGEYIVVQSSDDISHKERIQKEVDFLIKHPETACVGTNLAVFIGDLNNIVYIGNWISYDREKIESNYKKGIHCVCSGTILFRAYILEDIIGFKKITYGSADVHFLSEISNHDYIIDNINEVLFYYRRHINQKSVYRQDKTAVENKIKYIQGRVSVVLPLYRKQNNITSALKSILDQTYNDIEIIIVDDLLDTKIEEEVKLFYSEFIRDNGNGQIKDFIYFKLPKRVGYPWIYNIGAYLSRGEFIAFHGDNGVSGKCKLEKQANFLKDNFLYDAVGTNFDRNNEWIKYDDEIEYSYLVKYTHCVNINTLMIRSDIINKTAGLNQNIPNREAFAFIEGLIRSGNKVQNLKEVLYYEQVDKRIKSIVDNL